MKSFKELGYEYKVTILNQGKSTLGGTKAPKSSFRIPPKGTKSATLNKRCHLLELPAELRLEIYDLLFASFDTDSTHKELENYTVLLYVNKQVFSEAMPTFLKHERRLTSRLYEEWVAAYEETYRGPRHSPRDAEYDRLAFALRDEQNAKWLKYGRAKDRADNVDGWRVEIECMSAMARLGC